MTLRPSGKSMEETPMGGPGDGASAEVEISQSLNDVLFYRIQPIAYFKRLVQFQKDTVPRLRWREGGIRKPPAF